MHLLPTIVFNLDYHQHEGRLIIKSLWQFLQRYAAIVIVIIVLISRFPRNRSIPRELSLKIIITSRRKGLY
jgi:hypothetical protein